MEAAPCLRNWKPPRTRGAIPVQKRSVEALPQSSSKNRALGLAGLASALRFASGDRWMGRHSQQIGGLVPCAEFGIGLTLQSVRFDSFTPAARGVAGRQCVAIGGGAIDGLVVS